MPWLPQTLKFQNCLEGPPGCFSWRSGEHPSARYSDRPMAKDLVATWPFAWEPGFLPTLSMPDSVFRLLSPLFLFQGFQGKTGPPGPPGVVGPQVCLPFGESGPQTLELFYLSLSSFPITSPFPGPLGAGVNGGPGIRSTDAQLQFPRPVFIFLGLGEEAVPQWGHRWYSCSTSGTENRSRGLREPLEISQ